MSPPSVYVHRVRFDEVDAAGIVYFAHFFRWCHDAMAAALGDLPGGYASLVTKRRLGLPAVHVDADFAAPLRFGDEVHIASAVDSVGNSSCAWRFDVACLPDRPRIATVRHVVVLTDLAGMRATPFPDDLRTILESLRS